MNVEMWFFFIIIFLWIEVREIVVIIWERNVNVVLIVYNNLINICLGNGYFFDDILLIMFYNLGFIIKYRKKFCLLII